jgi:hypothetical protein
VEQELPTFPEHMSSPPVFNGVRVARSLDFCVMFWPLCCLSLLDLRFLITPLVSSNISCIGVLLDISRCNFTYIDTYLFMLIFWIYRCLSPLMLWGRIPVMARCTTLCDKVCQWLAAGRCFIPGTWLPAPIKLIATI